MCISKIIIRIDSLKICAIRETVEETGIWPFGENIKTFEYSRDKFNDFINLNAISLDKILKNNVYEWVNWRTPDCKKIYPQKWDMQMFVAEADKISMNPKFYSYETVEVNWMFVDEVLERCKRKDLYLAPPQWYMLKEIQKFTDHTKYIQTVKNIEWPRFIQPRLVSSKDEAIWHSILPKDLFYNDEGASVDDILKSRGPFQRITMKLSSGKFHSFELIDD